MYRELADKEEAVQAIEGTLLSDAGVYIPVGCKDAHYVMNQSYREHLDWLLYLEACLNMLGIGSSIRRFNSDLYRDGCYYRLCSKINPWLTQQRHRWYPNGRKAVPSDLRLTAAHIANWLAGDGSIVHSWPQNRVYRPGLKLLTLGFDNESLNILEKELFRVGITDVTRGIQKGKNGKWLTIGCDGTAKIWSAVLEYLPPSYTYKLPGRRVYTK
ncbi:hypothetical protein MUP59_07050 [Candidatus Bathyarchaeota archaeon]|nr:hypothetical protein [Candidatus Bathyarchaeota archaeon]